MGRCAVLAEVVVNLKTIRPTLNKNNGDDANVKDMLYRDNRDVNTFGFANMSKI